MKKGFKLLSIGLAIATAFSVTACGDDGGKSGDEIRIFTYSGNEFDGVTMDSVFKKIEEKVFIFRRRDFGRLLHSVDAYDGKFGLPRYNLVGS